jgi:hypothetical protein
MRTAQKTYGNIYGNRFARDEAIDLNSTRIQGNASHHIEQLDQGKRIDLNDIIKFIEKNKQFIDNPQIEILDINESYTEKRIQEVRYNLLSDLNDLPTNLTAVFGSINSFKRIGTVHLVTTPADINVSLISSILYLLSDDFIRLNESSQIEFTETFIRRIHKESRKKFAEYGYDKLGWDHRDFINNVKCFNLGKDLLRYVTDFLHINIFILDIDMDSLVYVGEKTYIKNKKNIFLIKHTSGTFEPVFATDCNNFDHNTSIIKKLLNSKFLVERMDCDFTHEKDEYNFIVGQDDLSKYIVDDDIVDDDIVIDNIVDDNITENNTIENNTIAENKNIRPQPAKSSLALESGSDDLNDFKEDRSNEQHNNANDIDDLESSTESSKSSKTINSNIVSTSTKPTNKKPVKSIKTHVVNNTHDAKKEPKQTESVKPIIKKIPSHKELQKLSLPELKQVAKRVGVALTYVKDGKRCNRTKTQLLELIV